MIDGLDLQKVSLELETQILRETIDRQTDVKFLLEHVIKLQEQVEALERKVFMC